MRVLVVALLTIPAAAAAQYKCTEPNGSVTFQQTPCAAAQQKQQKLDTKFAPAPAPGSSSSQSAESADVRIARNMERDRKILETEREIAKVAFTINTRNEQMDSELALLSNKKRYARNNLAGATYEQSISTEMQAVVAKHKAMNDSDVERLKQLRANLEAMKQQAAKK